MTRYSNSERNSKIVSMFLLKIPPKQIQRELGLSSVWLVYKVIKRLHVETSVQICPKCSLEKSKSTDLNS